MSQVLIKAETLGKAYPKVFRNADRMRSLLRLAVGRRPPEVNTVLSEVSFEVRRGQSLGVIGENGAGKSTLLKLLSGVLTPSAGSVKVDGSVAALLELGAGFHPEYSGRDNLMTAATLLGMSRQEVAEKTQEIIEFADLGHYIDEPIKHYSTGMVVRLGFAIVAARQPDILITDEVLAVGDESFQKKCVRWIEQYLARGGTLLLVSHSMYHVQKLCSQALWLKQGRVQQYGDVFDVTQSYLAFHERKTANEKNASPAALSAEHYRVQRFEVNGSVGQSTLAIAQGSDLPMVVDIHSPDDRIPQVLIGLLRADGTPIYGFGSELEGIQPERLEARCYRYRLRFEALSLLPGHYFVRAFAMDPEGLRMFDTATQDLIVRGESREMGMVRLPHHWD